MTNDPHQLPLFPDRAYLQKIVPELNQHRYYAMTAIPTLFGEWALMREWGRIGSGGTIRTDFYEDEGQAVTALADLAEKKRKRGYETVRRENHFTTALCKK